METKYSCKHETRLSLLKFLTIILFTSNVQNSVHAQNSFNTSIDELGLYEQGDEIEEVGNNRYVELVYREIEQAQSYTKQFSLLYLMDHQGNILAYDSLIRGDTVFLFYRFMSYGIDGLVVSGAYGFYDETYRFQAKDPFICYYDLSNDQFDLQWIRKYRMSENDTISSFITRPMLKPGTDTCFIGRSLVSNYSFDNYFFCFDPQTGDSLMMKKVPTPLEWLPADILFSAADTNLHLFYHVGSTNEYSAILLKIYHSYNVADTLFSHPHLYPWYAKAESHPNGNIYIGGEASWYDWDQEKWFNYFGIYSYTGDLEPISSIYLTHPDTTSQTGWAETIRVSPDGYIYVISNYYFHGSPFSGAFTYLYLAKLDEDLNLIWEKYIGGDRYYSTNALAATYDGGVIVSGYGYDKEVPETRGFAWICKFDADGLVNVEEQKIPVLTALLYPNPAGSLIYLQSNHPNGDLQFYDLSGRLRHSVTTKSGLQEIDLQGLVPGNYMAVFYVHGKQIHSQKIIKY